MTRLDLLAKTDQFMSANKGGQAEMIAWHIFRESGLEGGVALTDIADAFVELHLVRPNLTRIRDHFRTSKKIRSLGKDRYAPTREFTAVMEDRIPEPELISSDTFDIDSIVLPPFVTADRKTDLSKMIRAYAYLFLLENSMRGLIEIVLGQKLGSTWWDQASNTAMRKKHADRVQNESSKKWAPTRADYGPLYALDWSDLITLMRKYEQEFIPYIKYINFLHRFEDAGTFRNVVAHNGILKDDDEFNLIRIYYRDWIRQLT